MAKAHTLSDNFNDNATDTSKWLSFGYPQEVNQRLEVRLGGLSKTASGYTSTAAYDLTGSSFKLQVLQTVRAVVGARTFLRAFVTEDVNEVGILVENGMLHCGQTVNGTRTTLASVPYEPTRHLWWRLREVSGTTWWETSGDGKRWEVLCSKANPIPLTQVKLSFGAGRDINIPSLGLAIFDSVNGSDTGLSRRVEERRLSALGVREQAAELAAARPHPEHYNNNDEVNYPDYSFIGNYSKGLRHDAVGDPEPVSYGSLLRALESRDPGDFEEILQPAGAKKLTNPQAGLAFDLAGPDTQAVTMPPAPRFDSQQAAHEMGELYWMALARDVPFIAYDSEASTAGSIIERAIHSLNKIFPDFGGADTVTAQNLFRGIYLGEQVGPYVSQFLLKGNSDPRKPEGHGRSALDGYITYGSQVIDQRQWTVKGFPQLGAGADYLTDFAKWLAVQNGVDTRGGDQFDMTQRRFIRNLRDGANYVHFDQVVNAFYNAAFLLMSEPTGDQLRGTGRPMVDLEFPKNEGNPYDPPGTARDSRTQVGFTTFGPIHLLQTLIEVAGRTGRAVWWQKWGVHRRLRPEEYGGRVHNALTNRGSYPFNASIRNALQSTHPGDLGPVFRERYGSGSYLLPQAYPEGAPTHPAYGAGHASISGACATILKAFFDERAPIENPVLSNAEGTALVPYTGADAEKMTVGGELNKLAGNISLFRNAAGVHWRSDYTESVILGEKVAIGLLQEMSLTFNEDDAFFQLTKFDGTTIRIFDGCVEPVPAP